MPVPPVPRRRVGMCRDRNNFRLLDCSPPSIKAAILDRLGHMGGFNVSAFGKVSDGPGNLQDTMIGTGRQPQSFNHLFDQFMRRFIEMAEFLDLPWAHLAVAMNSFMPSVSLHLNLPGLVHSFLDGNRRYSAICLGHFLEPDRRYFEMEIDPV